MDELIKSELEQAQPTEFHRALLTHCKGLVALSRSEVNKKYPAWDHNLDVYESTRQRDDSDKEAKNRKEPEKFIVPLTYSQVQTFVAFNMSLFTQRERMFELVGRGEEDHKAAKVGEALLDRDLNWNVFDLVLYQFLEDVSRFGVGILKTAWTEEREQKWVTIPGVPVEVLGQTLGGAPMDVQQDVVTYQGNKVTNISPYNFYPDPRVPLTRFQEGEFVASEQSINMPELRRMEANGDVAGIQHVRQMTKDILGDRRLYGQSSTGNAAIVAPANQSHGTVILTEVQVTLIPSDFKIEGKPMGESTRPEKWVVWYVNDERVIKAEQLGYKHHKFTYDVGQYSPDMHRQCNMSLGDTIDKLQDVVSWLINSHITNVRKVIGDKLVVDPAGVEMKDLVERRPVIRLQAGVARQGVDKFVKQLAVTDVTATHMRDAQELHNLVQVTTGINDNALGQYNTGRRSATEARNVNSSAAARLKIIALLLFKSALEPMARKMLSNLQDGLTAETYVKVVGEMADPMAFGQFVKVTRDDMVGEYDFEIFDGTLPSERGVQASALEEFLVAIMKTPQMVMLLGYDPQKLVEEWLELRGIRNPKRFLLDPVRQQQMAVQMQQLGIYGQPTQPGQPRQPGLSQGQAGPPLGPPSGLASLVGSPSTTPMPMGGQGA